MDFFDKYFDFVEKNTESPMTFHRWCAISAISAMLGRRVWITLGHHKIYPNFYTMLIGPPGTRKSTAINIAKRLMDKAGYKTFAPSKTSKEQFLADLAVGFDKKGEPKKFEKKLGDFSMDDLKQLDPEEYSEEMEPHEVTICSGEFNSFIGLSGFEFISLLGDLWDNLEKFDVRNRTTTNSFVPKPTVNILGGNTQTNLMNAFPPDLLGQGFMSRMVLINADGARQKITFPDPCDEALEAELADMLQTIKMNLEGEVTLTTEAKELLDALYHQERFVDDPRFQYYENRRFDHLLKVCIVVAAGQCKQEINAQDVMYANSILCYAEQEMPKALGEFGKSKYSDLNNKIMTILYDYPLGLTLDEIFKKVMQDADNIKMVAEVLQNLMKGERIRKPTPLSNKFIAIKAVKIDPTFFQLELLRERCDRPAPVDSRMAKKGA